MVEDFQFVSDAYPHLATVECSIFDNLFCPWHTSKQVTSNLSGNAIFKECDSGEGEEKPNSFGWFRKTSLHWK